MTLQNSAPEHGLDLYNAWVPKLPLGEYTLEARQTVKYGDGENEKWEFVNPSQKFTVGTPRYSLTAEDVVACFPAANSSAPCEHLLPYVSLANPYLPWERPAGIDEKWQNIPAMVVLLLADGEVGAEDVKTGMASKQLREAPETTLLPKVTDILLADAPCTTIDLDMARFKVLMPQDPQSELPYLAHVRRQTGTSTTFANTEETPWRACSTLISSRFPRMLKGKEKDAVKQPCHYTAHVVSLIGHEGHLGEYSGKQTKIRLLSLWSWSFNSISGEDPSYVDAFTHMKTDTARSSNRLRYTAPATAVAVQPTETAAPAADQAVGERLKAGYVPMAHTLVTGERTVSWYRGPLGPWPAPTPPQEHVPFRSADEALIYHSSEGMFDISLASAWTMGSQLVLSRKDLFDQLFFLSSAGSLYLMTVAAATHGNLAHPPELQTALLAEAAADAAQAGTWRHKFDQLMAGTGRPDGQGLGDSLTSVFGEKPKADRLALHITDTSAAEPGPILDHAVSLLEQDPVVDGLHAVLRNTFTDISPSLSFAGDGETVDWLWNPPALLALLPSWHLMPLAHVVLPPDSVRFFSLDHRWLSAFADGMLAVAGHTAVDQAVAPHIKKVAFRPNKNKDGRVEDSACGVLIRSQIIRKWPENISGIFTVVGGDSELITQRNLGPDTSLLMLTRLPDKIIVREPAHTLEFGLDNAEPGTKALRGNDGKVTEEKIQVFDIGGPGCLKNDSVSDMHQREVVDIKKLVAAISAVQKKQVNSGSFALQMLHPPAVLTITAPAKVDENATY
ncbi:hypothetical protein ACIQWR_40970 [Streptomyces sp. NPDC098789]|uniref:hypothetical protein n=1 Tax=Streptomyces sp. NPDC098789 TaxID=3366098 RepID=UPI0037F73ADC